MTTPFDRKDRVNSMGILGSVLWLAVTLSVSQIALAETPAAESGPDQATNEVFNLHLDVPSGSRIDYLRIYYYDTSASTSHGFLTTYDDVGGYTDLTAVSSVGDTGYGTVLSPLLSHVVDNVNSSYVLNWRANAYGSEMRLCGFRIAYRLPVGGGWSGLFSYVHVAGSTLRPRNSDTGWFSDSSGGCVSAALPILPLIFADGFESGNTSAWSAAAP